MSRVEIESSALLHIEPEESVVIRGSDGDTELVKGRRTAELWLGQLRSFEKTKQNSHKRVLSRCDYRSSRGNLASKKIVSEKKKSTVCMS